MRPGSSLRGLALLLLLLAPSAAASPRPAEPTTSAPHPSAQPAPAQPEAAQPAPAQPEAPRRRARDWLIPTGHGAGFVTAMYFRSVAIWPQSFAVADSGHNWRRFRQAFSAAPEWRRHAGAFAWDGDPWTINVIGHGLFGSEFYLRHRQYRHAPWVAAAMTVAWSLTWEFLIESWHKQPSGIDLVWTPSAGALLGEGRYQLYRRVCAMRRTTGRHVLLYLVDPFGQLERDLLRLPD
ncbi:MAG: DUF3943 domain-containing protein [Proteobacteria bacterium]|nr:DUF3943 domain-containing protein [Pseudomonadota bacterium]